MSPGPHLPPGGIGPVPAMAVSKCAEESLRSKGSLKEVHLRELPNLRRTYHDPHWTFLLMIRNDQPCIHGSEAISEKPVPRRDCTRGACQMAVRSETVPRKPALIDKPNFRSEAL